MEYIIYFDIAAILVSFYTIFFMTLQKGMKRKTNKMYFLLMITTFAAAVTDCISAVCNMNMEHYGLAVSNFWNYMYLGIHNLTPFALLTYEIYLLGINRKMHRWHFACLCIPITLTFLLLALNPFHQGVFYFNENHIYTHGSIMVFLYINAAVYVIAVMILIFYFRNAFSKMKRYSLLMFVVSGWVSVLIQAIVPNLLIECFLQSLAVFGGVLSVENKDEMINSVTEMENQYALINDISIALETRSQLRMIVVKILDVRYYNTVFGIRFINAMLRRIAAWLGGLDRGMACYDAGNHNFVLLTYGQSEEKLQAYAQVINQRFQSEWEHGNVSVLFPVRIHILKMPEDIKTIEQLMMLIDTPVSEENGETGIVTVQEFDTYKREVLIEQKLREALHNHKFQMWYQPIWDYEKKVIHSAEALIRLIDDELGFISPEEFIPIAEKSGLIVEIGEFVVDEVCRFYSEAKLEQFGIDFIEINLSVAQCMDRKLPKNMDRFLKKYGLAADRLNLEITETAVANNYKALFETTTELAKRGFSLSLDDYGTGYSNFSYMFGMPFSIVKLDKSILWEAIDPKTAAGDESARIFLKRTIEMLREMNYRVVVEGVETEEQKKFLEDNRCDYFQGYYFSKPVNKQQFLEYVHNFNRNLKV